MEKKTLERARQLERDRQQAEEDLRRTNEVLADFDKFRSTIQFTKESDSTRGFNNTNLSFGSKKFDFKQALRPVVEGIKQSLEKEIVDLQTEFDAL